MTEPIKVVLCTEVNSKLGAPFLRLLSAHPLVELLAVVTSPPGRLCAYFVDDPVQVDVAQEAAALGVTVLRPEQASAPEVVAALRGMEPDYLIVANFQQRLSTELLAVARVAALNFHPSPLPRYAGLAPFYWMVRNGERQGAVSVIMMDAGLDTGPIVCQRAMAVREEDTGLSLRTRQEQQNILMLLDLIPALTSRNVTTLPQDLGSRSYFSRPIEENYRLDPRRDCDTLLRHIRAAYRSPGAFHVLDDGTRLTVLSAKPASKHLRLPPPKALGQIVRTHSAVYLGVADGWLQLLTIEQGGAEVAATTLDLPAMPLAASMLTPLAMGPADDPSDQDPATTHPPAPYRFISQASQRTVWMSGDEYRIRLGARESANGMTLIEAIVPPGGGPPVHAHEDTDELFVIQEGELRFTVDGIEKQVAAGDCVFVGRSVPHAFFNPTAWPARMLLFYTPAGAEEFFLAAGVPAIAGQAPPAVDPVSRAREIAVAARHGITQARTPLARSASVTEPGGH
ncbi:cupin domain-containing protein [Delftia lacustris]|uniref:formyltransferase family protein n=1 Tax=Delftia lacustris TaxID=558537 RepID=UPI00193C1CD1|nr:formyltransferase family protein [Delftia lacustris]QRI92986.1 cupin domain-containing protein [Delftia lacustris]